MRRFALALGIACLAAWPAWAQPQIQIPQGTLSGAGIGSVSVFKGIPFAAPPVGHLRWRAPQAPANWTGMRDATAFGPVCPQQKRQTDARSLPLPESEDCLTLNVWTPNAAPTAKLPVMVWIYGGAFVMGGSAFPVYDGIELAQHGVIVVTLNYRLGRLGFFAHPALAAENRSEPGVNFGLLDQIAALQWVKNNIAAFGGDPSNVTIFGESAGGISVNDLIVSPPARGLFAKAISESGLGLQLDPTLQKAQDQGAEFAGRMNATGSPSDTLAKLRALTVDQILDDQTKSGGVSPIVDGTVLPDQPTALYAAGKVAPVPYLAGSNSNESTLMDAFHLTTDDFLKGLGSTEATIRSVYEQDGKLSDDQFARQLYTDSVFAAGAQGLANFMTKAGEPAYVYHFAYVAQNLRLFVSGVQHGGEVAYVFGFTGLGEDPNLAKYAKLATDGDKSIAAMMENYWTDFAKAGNPNGAGLPQWDVTAPGTPQTLVVKDDTKTVQGFRKSQLSIVYIGLDQRLGINIPN
jgi:para-nitrobenzyl esterase